MTIHRTLYITVIQPSTYPGQHCSNITVYFLSFHKLWFVLEHETSVINVKVQSVCRICVADAWSISAGSLHLPTCQYLSLTALPMPQRRQLHHRMHMEVCRVYKRPLQADPSTGHHLHLPMRLRVSWARSYRPPSSRHRLCLQHIGYQASRGLRMWTNVFVWHISLWHKTCMCECRLTGWPAELIFTSSLWFLSPKGWVDFFHLPEGCYTIFSFLGGWSPVNCDTALFHVKTK